MKIRLKFAFDFPTSCNCNVLHFIFVFFREGRHETFFYSYPSHLDELIDCLKEDGYENPLVQTLEEKYSLIVHHMKCTEDLTNNAKGLSVYSSSCSNGFLIS